MFKNHSARLVVVTLVFLAACARDNYTLADGKPIADQDGYSQDLKDCKRSVVENYFNNTPFFQRVGVLAGLAGGAVGGALAGSEDKSDINKQVSECMIHKGYAGTSS